jgi:rhodanese-related sulfurtransferase
MLKRLHWIILLMIALAAFVGCSDDDDPVTPPSKDASFDVMAKAVEDYINGGDCPGVIDATVLKAGLDENPPVNTVIDIRSETHYNAGHIAGAYHSSLATILDDLESGDIPDDKTLVITCYTGQSAGHAKIALEMMGYECKSLKFGMSSWSPDVQGTKWSDAGKCANHCATVETDNNNADLTEHAYPDLSSYASGTVVADRVAEMLTDGFKSVMYTDIQNDLGDYFILNYWGETDYDGSGGRTPGHIPGAYQFTPGQSLARSAMLKNLPTDKQIVVYCWTGQTSSQITAALSMLGYDAVSLGYGANNLFYDELGYGKWSAAAVMDYPLVTK